MLQIEAKNKTDVIKVADWSTETGYKGATNYVKEKFPRFFRIGTVEIQKNLYDVQNFKMLMKEYCNFSNNLYCQVAQMPWASYKFDERGMIMRDENNMPILTGYCVEVRMKNI